MMLSICVTRYFHFCVCVEGVSPAIKECIWRACQRGETVITLLCYVSSVEAKKARIIILCHAHMRYIHGCAGARASCVSHMINVRIWRALLSTADAVIKMAMARKPLSARDNAQGQRVQSGKVGKKSRYPFCLLNRSTLISNLKQSILKPSTSLSEDDLMRPTVSLQWAISTNENTHPKGRRSLFSTLPKISV